MNNESSWANNNDKPSTMSNQDNKTQNLSLANTSFCDVIAD